MNSTTFTQDFLKIMDILMSGDCLDTLQKIQRNYRRGIITHDEMVEQAAQTHLNQFLVIKELEEVVA